MIGFVKDTFENENRQGVEWGVRLIAEWRKPPGKSLPRWQHEPGGSRRSAIMATNRAARAAPLLSAGQLRLRPSRVKDRSTLNLSWISHHLAPHGCFPPRETFSLGGLPVSSKARLRSPTIPPHRIEGGQIPETFPDRGSRRASYARHRKNTSKTNAQADAGSQPESVSNDSTKKSSKLARQARIEARKLGSF